MPIPFTVTREDLLRSKTLDPGWYKATIKKIWQEPSNAGDSTNTWAEFSVVEGPAQKDNSNPQGTPLRRCFSEKAPGMIVPFLVAMGAKVTENGGTFDVEKGVGRDILVYNENKMYEGRMLNNVSDFKAITNYVLAPLTRP